MMILATIDASMIAAVSALVALGVSAITFVRLAGGKANERQIEPTSLAAIQQEMRQQTQTLAKLDRESGETRAAVGSLREEVTRMRAEDIQGIFRRMNAISQESTETKTRVNILEQSHAHHTAARS